MLVYTDVQRTRGETALPAQHLQDLVHEDSRCYREELQDAQQKVDAAVEFITTRKQEVTEVSHATTIDYLILPLNLHITLFQSFLGLPINLLVSILFTFESNFFPKCHV